jgi:hypothetical protein
VNAALVQSAEREQVLKLTAEPISIDRCRELLGEDAESMTDQDIENIRRHPETMAYFVVEMFRSSAALPSRNCASQTPLARRGEWIYAANHGRRGDLRSRQHEGADRNLSLPTQLRACEEYCRRQGYEILERFHEEGESAKSTDR